MALAGEPIPAAPDIEQLCAQLGSESYDTRETAHRALLALGKQAKERLQSLQRTSEDAEVVWRSTAILRDIAEREQMEDLFGRDGEATFTEEELTEAKTLAQRLEDGGVQHRNNVYEELGPAKLPRMLLAMRAWMRRNPKDGNVAYNLGYTHFWMERYRQAAAVWLYTETIAPNESRAFNDAAIAFDYDGRYDEAVAQYKKTMERFPNFAHPFRDLAYLKATMGDHKVALELHLAARNMWAGGDPGSSYEAMLAEYQADNGKLEDAEKSLKRAFALTEERIYAYGCRYTILRIHGRFEELKKLTAEAAKEYPKHSDVLLMQALTANLAGDSTAALKILDQLIAQRGETNSLRCHKASFLMGTGQHEESGAILRQLLEHNPRNPNTLAAATNWARATKRWREAVEYATARTQLLPNVPNAHAELAAIYATAEDPKIRNLERARDLAGVAERLIANSYYYGTARLNRAELDAELSHVYEASGKWAEALARHRSYAELVPWNKEAQERLAKLSAAAKEHPETKAPAP
jgi:Flp pilus assembly protein TadD